MPKFAAKPFQCFYRRPPDRLSRPGAALIAVEFFVSPCLAG
jgi:hypothetical protein